MKKETIKPWYENVIDRTTPTGKAFWQLGLLSRSCSMNNLQPFGTIPERERSSFYSTLIDLSIGQQQNAAWDDCQKEIARVLILTGKALAQEGLFSSEKVFFQQLLGVVSRKGFPEDSSLFVEKIGDIYELQITTGPMAD